jgi:hypothetical protein
MLLEVLLAEITPPTHQYCSRKFQLCLCHHSRIFTCMQNKQMPLQISFLRKYPRLHNNTVVGDNSSRSIAVIILVIEILSV